MDFSSLPSLPDLLTPLRTAYGSSPGWTCGLYCVVLALVSALSLPASGVMLLAGGAVFGAAGGTLLGTAASTAGALLTALAARHALRPRLQPWLERRWPQHLATFEHAAARDGARTLLSLRLLPVVPYPVTNLLAGLSPMPLRTFIWASFLGMLPGTWIYAHAGAQLAQAQGWTDLLEPGVLAALVLLALLPWLPRWGRTSRGGERA